MVITNIELTFLTSCDVKTVWTYFWCLNLLVYVSRDHSLNFGFGKFFVIGSCTV